MNKEVMEPCRRASGSFRAHFPSKEAAEAFAAGPANTDYHGDIPFNAAVSLRRRIPAATWSSVWYLLSAFAVISYTHNWVYVGLQPRGLGLEHTFR